MVTLLRDHLHQVLMEYGVEQRLPPRLDPFAAQLSSRSRLRTFLLWLSEEVVGSKRREDANRLEMFRRQAGRAIPLNRGIRSQREHRIAL